MSLDDRKGPAGSPHAHDRSSRGAPPPCASLVETHSSVVFFYGDRAFKVKKPVDLGFLDFTTREARETACHREVALNRRLAPDVYLGVADVRDPSGELCDHLVVMRRLPAERRLATLVGEGRPVGPDLRRLARQLAAMHARSGRSVAADLAAGAEAQSSRWRSNTEALLAGTGGILDARAVALVQALAARYIDGRGALLADRVAAGRACDGHGDLLADDVFCLDDGPRALDCLEFDDALRLGDGLADVAFLAMDLERLQRPDLATSFLGAYAEEADDQWPQSLVGHYIAYRAQVRAKVEAIKAEQGDPEAAERARTLLDLALSHLRSARVRLVLIGGAPGTGKSTLAHAVGAAIGAVVIRSDVVRKELAGISPTTQAPSAYGEGLYSPAATAGVYARILQLADDALSHGETVVVDASWGDGAWREQARRTASETHADLIELCCVLPAPVAAARMVARSTAGGDPSDATPAVAAAMAAVAQPWPSSTPISTAQTPSVALADALERVAPHDDRPKGHRKPERTGADAPS